VGREYALDAVKRAADYCQVAVVEAVCGKAPTSELEQLFVVSAPAPILRLTGSNRRKDRSEIR
jgi:hypothetical protein